MSINILIKFAFLLALCLQCIARPQEDPQYLANLYNQASKQQYQQTYPQQQYQNQFYPSNQYSNSIVPFGSNNIVYPTNYPTNNYYPNNFQTNPQNTNYLNNNQGQYWPWNSVQYPSYTNTNTYQYGNSILPYAVGTDTPVFAPING